MTSFLAIIELGNGVGSWHRSKTRQQAIDDVMRLAYADWRTLYKLDGHPVIVNVADVTDRNVHWDSRGVFDSDTKEPIALEQVNLSFPTRRGRRSSR